MKKCVKVKKRSGLKLPNCIEKFTRKEQNMEGYTFEDMWLDLKNGYQIYYTYVRNRYVLFKTAKNCYTQKLLTDNPKNPQPRMTMLTLKRVKEMFPYMENIEYKVMSDTNLMNDI